MHAAVLLVELAASILADKEVVEFDLVELFCQLFWEADCNFEGLGVDPAGNLGLKLA